MPIQLIQWAIVMGMGLGSFVSFAVPTPPAHVMDELKIPKLEHTYSADISYRFSSGKTETKTQTKVVFEGAVNWIPIAGAKSEIAALPRGDVSGSSKKQSEHLVLGRVLEVASKDALKIEFLVIEKISGKVVSAPVVVSKLGEEAQIAIEGVAEAFHLSVLPQKIK